jgi:hypothetical protein
VLRDSVVHTKGRREISSHSVTEIASTMFQYPQRYVTKSRSYSGLDMLTCEVRRSLADTTAIFAQLCECDQKDP